jgi:type IV pilus assembly protein PilM
VLPKLFAKKFLGIDIGTSAIRIVELEKGSRNFVLTNYGQIDLEQIDDDGLGGEQKRAVIVFSADEISQMIQTILADAKIKTRQCAFSIPDFSTFFTAFTLPPMTEKELAEAVIFEARQHIPLPIESVNIDWQLISGGAGNNQKIEVAVAAIPNEIIAQYKEIAVKAKLKVVLMEAEMFGLAKALVPKDEERLVCLIDIGAQSTVCSLVEKHILRYSHSFDRGANYLAQELASRLPVNQELANNIKESYGLKLLVLADPEIKEKINALLREAIMPVFHEVDIMLGDYQRTSGVKAAKMIVSGAIAAIPEIKRQFTDYFGKEVEIADPFKNIDYVAALDEELRSIGSAYAVAVGMAERGLEFPQHRKNPKHSK